MTTRNKFLETQLEILVFIDRFITEIGYSPSIRDICNYTGLSSPSTIKRRLDDMEKRGWISRDKKTNRSIVVHEHRMSNEDDAKIVEKYFRKKIVEEIKSKASYDDSDPFLGRAFYVISPSLLDKIEKGEE